MNIQDLEINALDRLLYTLEERSYSFLCEKDDDFSDFIVSLYKDVTSEVTWRVKHMPKPQDIIKPPVSKVKK
jgi:hypothetical protein